MSGICCLTRPRETAYTLATETKTIGDHNIEETIEERDLGMLITETLSPSHHIANIVRTPSQIDGMIRRTYEERSNSKHVPLHDSQVSPHVQHCGGVVAMYLHQDINNIEGEQRSITKMMREVEEEDYEQRMKKMKLIS